MIATTGQDITDHGMVAATVIIMPFFDVEEEIAWDRMMADTQLRATPSTAQREMHVQIRA